MLYQNRAQFCYGKQLFMLQIAPGRQQVNHDHASSGEVADAALRFLTASVMH